VQIVYLKGLIPVVSNQISWSFPTNPYADSPPGTNQLTKNLVYIEFGLVSHHAVSGSRQFVCQRFGRYSTIGLRYFERGLDIH